MLSNEIQQGNVTKQRVESHLNLVGSTMLERLTSATTGTYQQVQASAKKFNEAMASGTAQPGDLQVIQAHRLRRPRCTGVTKLEAETPASLDRPQRVGYVREENDA